MIYKLKQIFTMKNINFIHLLILLLGFLLLSSEKTYAQKDSMKRDTVKKEYIENRVQYDSYLKRREKYDYLTRAKVEELSMFKVGLAFISSPDIYASGPSIGFERKINPDYSIMGEVVYGVRDFGRSSFVYILAYRYYFNMSERIWEGKSANNLSDSYTALQLIGADRFSAVEGLYGVQTKLGRLFYMNANIGGEIDNNFRVQPVLNLDIGFGF